MPEKICGDDGAENAGEDKEVRTESNDGNGVCPPLHCNPPGQLREYDDTDTMWAGVVGMSADEEDEDNEDEDDEDEDSGDEDDEDEDGE